MCDYTVFSIPRNSICLLYTDCYCNGVDLTRKSLLYGEIYWILIYCLFQPIRFTAVSICFHCADFILFWKLQGKTLHALADTGGNSHTLCRLHSPHYRMIVVLSATSSSKLVKWIMLLIIQEMWLKVSLPLITDTLKC